MNLAPWRSPLTRALKHHSNLPQARFVQLATIDINGYPSNRTVVFRGFLDHSNDLQFITDIRSAKIEHIKKQPQAEICWYFPQTREQFRIRGEIILIDGNYSEIENLKKARSQMWKNLSETARKQFTWPEPEQQRAEIIAFNQPQPDENSPLENFCLLLLKPQKVDHLKLKGNPQNRYIYKLDHQNNWQMIEVNP
jgi:pyridoxamine 5'-phosphate oxidase